MKILSTLAGMPPHKLIYGMGNIRLEKWKRRIPLIYNSTKSKSKRAFLGSVLVQMTAHEQAPSAAQEQLLDAWYKHYLSKNQVLNDAIKGLIS